LDGSDENQPFKYKFVQINIDNEYSLYWCESKDEFLANLEYVFRIFWHPIWMEFANG
jgi:hypothetical protein